VIRAHLRGAFWIVRILGLAAHHPHVAWRDLVHPPGFSRPEVERDDRIGGALRRVGVPVPRCDVDRAALWIDGGRGPDAAARRAPRLHAILVLATRLRFFRDAVGLPHD